MGLCSYLSGRNPLLQCLYIAILIGCYATFIKVGYPYIPLESFHRVTGPLALLSCALTFLAASFISPGRVHDANVYEYANLYPYDGIYFVADIPCPTCEWIKPARSKHCSLCKQCILGSDHHCYWINNCVGLLNHRYFYSFLVTNVIMTGYGVIVLLAQLLGHLVKDHIIGSEFLILPSVMNINAQEYHSFVPTPSLFLLMRYVTYYYTALIFLFFICTLFFILISAFLLQHTFLMLTNATTNERHKRSEFRKGKDIHDHYHMLQLAAKEREVALQLAETQSELLELEPKLHSQHPEQSNAILKSVMTNKNNKIAEGKIKDKNLHKLTEIQKKTHLDNLFTLQDELMSKISNIRRELHEMPAKDDQTPVASSNEIQQLNRLPNPYNVGIIENLKQFWFPTRNPKQLSKSWVPAYRQYQLWKEQNPTHKKDD